MLYSSTIVEIEYPQFPDCEAEIIAEVLVDVPCKIRAVKGICHWAGCIFKQNLTFSFPCVKKPAITEQLTSQYVVIMHEAGT